MDAKEEAVVVGQRVWCDGNLNNWIINLLLLLLVVVVVVLF